MITVLIVDDEPIFRSVIAKLLQKRGFSVLEADCANAALAYFADPGTKVDLVLVDVVLPQKSGLKLADQIKELNHEAKLLFMSGYPLHVLERQYGMSRDLVPFFLRKPFDTRKLAAKILEVLELPKLEGAL